jgi:hypothetical protein
MITTLKELSQADWDLRKTKTPNFPDNARVFTKFRDSTANELTKSIIAWFKLSGGQAERISVTGRYIDQKKIVTNSIGQMRQIGSGKWIKSSMRKGSADVSAILNGKSYRVEVKIGSDTHKENQKEYQKDFEKAGGIYFIAKTWDGFINDISGKVVVS